MSDELVQRHQHNIMCGLCGIGVPVLSVGFSEMFSNVNWVGCWVNQPNIFISANESLLKVFGKSKDGKIRAIKISIENEQLTSASVQNVNKDWEKDFDKMLKPFVQRDTPCYILYRWVICRFASSYFFS